MLFILTACTPGGELEPLESPEIVATPRDQAIQLNWDEVEGAVFYNTYFSKNRADLFKNSPQEKTELAEITIPNLDNEVTYYFAITSVGNSGESQITNIVETVPRPPPSKPENIIPEAGNESISISWDANAHAKSYNVYLARSPGITKDNITSLSGWMIIENVSNPFVQTGLVNGVPHYAVVTAVNDSGESALSDEIQTTPTISLKLSVGESHVCSIMVDKSLWCWGNNTNGQMGDGSYSNKSSPTAVSVTNQWSDISVGLNHSCAIDIRKNLWCWGDVVDGPDFITVAEPSMIDPEILWQTVYTGWDSTCAISNNKNKNFSCWGGSLKLPNSKSFDEFNVIPHAQSVTERYFDSSSSHSCLIDDKKKLWCWGTNKFGQLGRGFAVDDSSINFDAEMISGEWINISVNRGASSDDNGHSCGIKQDKSLWCWGANQVGQLGLGDAQDIWLPQNVASDTRWKEVALGKNHSCGIQTDNSLWCWGSNGFGQLGIPSVDIISTPMRVNSDRNWRQVSASSRNTCAAKFDGSVWCTGFNQSGQLGLGFKSFQSDPEKILSDVRQISVSDNYLCATDNQNKLYCWGNNELFELGIEPRLPRQYPVPITEYRQFQKVVTSCALTLENSIVCWDSKEETEGLLLVRNVIDEPEQWLNISIHTNNLCAIKINNSLWCLEDFDYFYQDYDVRKNLSTPTSLKQIDTSQSWISLSTSSSYGCAINNQKELFCWGDNNNDGTASLDGVLGNPEVSYTDIPVPVATDNRWKMVATGFWHVCAIDEENKLWCWGNNHGMQLGQSNERNILSPLLMDKNENWLTVSVSSNVITCAIKVDHTLWCWGTRLPITGQPNSNSFVTSATAVQITTDDDWLEVGVGSGYICAIKINRDLYCWGENDHGQIGNGKAWHSAWQQVDFSNANILLN